MLAIERLSNCNPRPFRAGSALKAEQLNDLASGNVALAMAMLEILNDSEHP
jgi:spermidine/putrescine-binding protein